MEFKVIVLVVALIGTVSCYSAGAPESECVSMTPQHHVEAQKSAFPYSINIAKRQIRSGETVQITIKGKSADDVIKGFIIQARNGATPIGVWDASPSASYAQLKNCGNSKSVSASSQCQGFSILIIIFHSYRTQLHTKRLTKPSIASLSCGLLQRVSQKMSDSMLP